MNREERITAIFEEEPQKLDSQVDSPKLNTDDFDDKNPMAPPEPEEEADSGESSEESAEPSTSESESSEGSKEEEEKLSPEEKEQAEDIAAIKKEVAESLLDPETVIALFDMIMSRLCTVANKSDKKDWKLDPDEIKIFEKLMKATMQEEGMAFWPAKYWIFVAILMIYGFKGFDVWENYYSDDALEDEANKKRLSDPKVKQKETQAKKEAVDKEVVDLEDLVKAERLKKELLDELEILTGPQGNGEQKEPSSTLQDNTGEITEEATAEEVTEETTAEEVTEEENSPEMETKGDIGPTPKKIDPDKWKDYRYQYDKKGDLIYNLNRTPRKRPGLKPGGLKDHKRNEKGLFIKK